MGIASDLSTNTNIYKCYRAKYRARSTQIQKWWNILKNFKTAKHERSPLNYSLWGHAKISVLSLKSKTLNATINIYETNECELHFVEMLMD